MHSQLLHEALQKEETRAIVIEVDDGPEEPGEDEEFYAANFELLGQEDEDEEGGATTASATTGEGFTGVRIRPLVHRPGAARAPPPQQGSGGQHQPGYCDADAALGECRPGRWLHGLQLREHEKPRGGI
jgi:hypothetical protein